MAGLKTDMLYIMKHLKLCVLLGCLLSAATLRAADDEELMQLEAQMLQLMGTNDRDTFFIVTEQLKDASRKNGNERLLYRAWGNQGIYEAVQQYYMSGLDTAREMMEYARREGSIYGEFAALHTEAMVLMQQQDYEQAEKVFLKAVDFRHRHFPNESAAEDLRELMKIAYLRGDVTMARNYANQLLAEPNLAPHHKGRALNRLCIMAFDEDDAEEFNKTYEEMKRLTLTDDIQLVTLYTEVNYNIINGDYKRALLLADRLAPDSCAERKAIIYHRLGDNAKAYEYMAQYKHISDSIARVSHNSTVANLYLRLNNERLRLEQELLARQNSQLRYRFYIAAGVILILILLFMIYQRHKIIRLLRNDNTLLDYGRKGAERALKDINELSFYESKTMLPLATSVKVNKLCDHLATITQRYCSRAVTVVFMTDFSDDFEIITNADALEKLLTHLLNDSSRFTQKGVIILQCSESGAFVRFSITDRSNSSGSKSKSQLSGLFSEQDDNARFVSLNFNVCQSISRLLRGRIWHDVEYTEGTRFCFEIPKEP